MPLSATVLRRFPFHRQLEAADCGAACLKMISEYHGATHAFSTLRELSYVRRAGASLLDLAMAVEKLGYQSRGVQVEDPEALDGEVPLPAIAHWDGDHYVVLYDFKKHRALVADPAMGIRKMDVGELRQHWDGILLLLEPTDSLFRQETSGAAAAESDRTSLLGRFVHGFLRYRALIAQILLATLLIQLVALAQPLLVQSLVDRAVGRFDLGLVTVVALGMVMVLIAQVVLTFIRSIALFFLSSSYAVFLLVQFWRRLLSLPLSFFAERHRGDLLRRIEDHERIRRLLQGAAVGILLDLLMVVTYSVILFVYGPAIFFMFAGGAALYAVWTFVLLPRRRELDHERFRINADASRLEIQMLTGIQTIKACNAEQHARWAWEDVRAREFHASRKMWLLDTLHQNGGVLITQATYLAVIVLEAHLVIAGQLTVGQMMATVAILGLVMTPLNNLVTFVHEMQEVVLSLRRVQVVYDTEPEDRGRLQSDDETALEGLFQKAPEIRVENVTFRYGSPADPAVLEDVTFRCPAGGMTAIVGRSGAGKSTLAHLLFGFYGPQKGRILYEGRPVGTIPPSALRRAMAYVLQKTDIFDGTLAENIALGDPEPDPRRILAAARTAALDDLLALPMGVATPIGERGISLSGGEEQRLQIARAIYRNPKVLLLDEATSHLDATTERAITEALRREAEGRTLVVIAHRLSTVRQADWIVVLERGRVVEQGTHAELMANRGGAYHQLVENQLQD